jgi:phosphoribosyl 1,2-cyclic phosphate phosphodiesterase
MRITVLGSGTSHGIPAVGCGCEVCCSPDPRDRRRRCSIVVEWAGQTLLVDTPPDLRLQVIESHVRRVDAILLTHSHADHIFGLDDVRRFNELQGGELPVYGRPDTLEDVRRAFRYVFVETQLGGGKPQLSLRPVEGNRLDWQGLPIEFIPVFHGRLEVLAFRFDRFAYVTDVSRIPPESLERLRGLDTLILDGLRWEPHPTHFSIDEAVEVARELAPRRTFLTHLAHTVPHAESERRLPPRVRLAYDGLVLQVPE